MLVTLYCAIGTIFTAIFLLKPKWLMQKGKEHKWDKMLDEIRYNYSAGVLAAAFTLFAILVFLAWPKLVIKKIIRVIKGEK